MLLALLVLGTGVQAQQLSQADTANTIPPKKNIRLPIVAAGSAALYGGSMIGLYQFWYKNHEQTAFHFFNDNDEWLLMDKAGHTFTAYYEGVYGMKMLQWAGLERKKAIWYGGAYGFLMQTPIEILDGFSSAWGFSWGDFAANTLGSGLFISQELLFEEQKVQLKFSFTPSPYAKLNPALLGESYPEQLIKDYNGQTYWLSAGLHNIIPVKGMPAWLNIAAGYGGDAMLRGTPHDQRMDPRFAAYRRQQQFYLSLDINLQKIKTNSKLLRNLFQVLAFVKIPAPTIEYSTDKRFKFHPIYF